MEPLLITLLGIAGMFLVMLVFKEFLPKGIKDKPCVLCLAVSTVWIILLILFFIGIFVDKTVIAILMGGTSVGLLNMLFNKLGVFKLPFLLTSFSIVYFILEGIKINTLYFLMALWIVFGVVYLFKSNKKVNVFVKKLVECCKNW